MTFKTCVLLGLVLLGPAVAVSSTNNITPSATSTEIRFSPAEISIIRNYYSTGAGANRGNGKGKPKRLPPGIAKQVANGKPLPPGIAKQVLPGALRLELPAVRDGYERIIVDGKVLLVEIGTQIVRDILSDIVLH